MALKHKDPQKVWDALHAETAFRPDFFLYQVEKEYAGRLIENLDEIERHITELKKDAIS